RATLLATIGLRGDAIGPELTAALFVMSQIVGAISLFPVVAALVAVAVVAARSDLPRWLTRASATVAGVWLLTGARLFTTSSAVWGASVGAFVSYGALVIAISIA